MKILRTIFLAPISWLYGMCVAVRNWVYDSELKEAYVPDIPVVSVGNLTVGGTGKTPFTEYLVQFLSSYFELAVLSRGYKRKTRGFILASEQSDYRQIGDEPSQIKMKFPSVTVAVCEDRIVGIKKIRELCPSVQLIIMDDAFQHRRVKPWMDIIMMDYNRPIFDDYVLPLGSLRDLPGQLSRADAVITSKCPEDITKFDMSAIKKYLNLLPYQTLSFTTLSYSEPIPLFRTPEFNEVYNKNTNVFVMAAIAYPQPLIDYVKEKYNLVGQLIFPDHHAYMVKDIKLLSHKLMLEQEDTIVIITEKDAVKICLSKKIPADIRKKIHYVSINHKFCLESEEENFKKRLLSYVTKYQKDTIEDSI